MDIVSPLSLLVLYGIFWFYFQAHNAGRRGCLPEGERTAKVIFWTGLDRLFT